MGLIALIFLPFRVLGVFTGFTFTDTEDFTPALSLFMGLACVVLIRRSSPRGTPISLSSLLLLLLLTLGPLLPNIGLFFLAREFQSVDGAWPQPMANDPKLLYGDVSPRFDTLSYVIGYLEAFSGAWIVIFLALYFTLKPNLSFHQLRICKSFVFISLFLVFIDPGSLYAWWLD